MDDKIQNLMSSGDGINGPQYFGSFHPAGPVCRCRLPERIRGRGRNLYRLLLASWAAAYLACGLLLFPGAAPLLVLFILLPAVLFKQLWQGDLLPAGRQASMKSSHEVKWITGNPVHPMDSCVMN